MIGILRFPPSALPTQQHVSPIVGPKFGASVDLDGTFWQTDICILQRAEDRQ